MRSCSGRLKMAGPGRPSNSLSAAPATSIRAVLDVMLFAYAVWQWTSQGMCCHLKCCQREKIAASQVANCSGTPAVRWIEQPAPALHMKMQLHSPMETWQWSQTHTEGTLHGDYTKPRACDIIFSRIALIGSLHMPTGVVPCQNSRMS